MKKTTVELKTEACSSSGIYQSESESTGLEIRANLIDSNPKLGIKSILEEISEQGSNQQIKNETKNKFIENAIYIALPWLILLFLTLMVQLIDVFCMFKSCPPCKRLQMKKANNIDKLKLVITLELIISIITLSICIAGLVISAQESENLKQIRCAMISLYTDVQEGTTYSSDIQLQKWKGLIGLNSKMKLIMYNLNFMIEKTQKISEQLNTDELDSDYQKLLSQNEKLNKPIIYTTGQSFYYSNSALSYIQDKTNSQWNLFITPKLSIITPQKQLFQQIYKNATSQLIQVKENVKTILKDQNNIRSVLETFQLKISEWVAQFEINIQDIFNSTELLQNNVEKLTIVPDVIFGIIISFQIFSLLSTVILRYFNKNLPKCKIIVCFTFICYFIGLIVCLFICVILSITNSIIAESCQYFDDLTTNQQTFKNSNLYDLNQELSQIFNQCLFEDGNFLQIFDLNTTLTQFQQLDQSLFAFVEAQTECWTSFQNGKINLAINQRFIKDFIDFRNIDYAEPIGEDGTNVKFVMKENFKACKTTSVIESQSDCAENSTYYDASLEQNFPTKTDNLCLQSSVFSYEYQNLQDIFQDCIKTDLNFANSFYQQQSLAWNTPWHTEIDTIKMHEENHKKLNETFKAVTDYLSELQGSLNLITDNDSGLVGGGNCKFLENSVKIAKHTICVRYLKFMYTIWILFAVVSFCLFLSHFCLMRILLGIKHIIEFQNPYVGNPKQPII